MVYIKKAGAGGDKSFDSITLGVGAENNLALAFGDGNTGFYEISDNTLIYVAAGTGRFELATGFMRALTTGGFYLGTSSSATAPSIGFRGDQDTGLGRGAADQLSVIAGGVEALRFIEDTGILQLHQITAGITADTGSSQGDGPIKASYNEISVCANAGDAVTLPSAVAGYKVTIINNGAQACDVFPATDDNLGAGADTAVSLAAGANITYLAYDAVNWATVV